MVYVIFDLLHYAGQGLLTCTWQERRTALEGLSLHGPHWATPPVYDDYAPLMATARVRGGHGILAKDRHGIYHPGIASPEWIDIGLDASACLVIGGYQREADGRGIRALMLGYFAKARDATRGILSYAGMVMANLDEPMLVELHQLLSSCEARSSPFTIINHLHDVVWCQPLITVEISDIAWLSKGQFSHARLVRLHPEVEPRTVLAPH